VKRLVLALLITTVVVTEAPMATATSGVVQVKAEVASTVSTSLPLVRLTFSSPVSASQLPALHVTPALPTSWQQLSPTMVQATPSGAPSVAGNYRITIPTALSCNGSCAIRTSRTVTTALMVSVLWQEQLLAELNYLPVSFTPTTPTTSLVAPTTGTFTWRFPQLTSLLASQWTPGTPSVILQGALMGFQDVNHLPTTGLLDSATWDALTRAATNDVVDPAAWNYVDVSETLPESLTLYVNGAPTFHTLVNTGIPQAPSTQGTFPVYLRYTSQTMRGTNPDGSTYNDPGIPWVSYFHGGEALHGYIRASYGFPQSLGCVEMPFASANAVWPHTPIGTLVTVRP